MKKLMILALIAFLAVSLFVACSSDVADDETFIGKVDISGLTYVSSKTEYNTAITNSPKTLYIKNVVIEGDNEIALYEDEACTSKSVISLCVVAGGKNRENIMIDVANVSGDDSAELTVSNTAPVEYTYDTDDNPTSCTIKNDWTVTDSTDGTVKITFTKYPVVIKGFTKSN